MVRALAAIVCFVSVCFCRLSAEELLPKPDHVVVVIFENHSLEGIMRSKEAYFIRHLGLKGALFTNAYGLAHPSQPNYLALFSGSTHGVQDDLLHNLVGDNLANALWAANKTFAGYVETGSPRKHNPWESFAAVTSAERNMREFPTDLASLPTVSFVIPNLKNDMHDGSILQADTWLKHHIGTYAQWATTHNSLLIIAFDEDDYKADNKIPLIISGAHVRSGRYDQRVTHFDVLSTIVAMYDLHSIGEADSTKAIHHIWQ